MTQICTSKQGPQTPSWEDISRNTQQVCVSRPPVDSYVQISVQNPLVHVSLFSQFVCFIYILLPLPESEPLVKTWNSFCKHPIYIVPAETFTVKCFWIVPVTWTHHCCSANIKSLFTFLYTSVTYIQVLLSFKSLAKILNYVKFIK